MTQSPWMGGEHGFSNPKGCKQESCSEFERTYPEKYERTHGFWRPIIRKMIARFLKCGDLKEGFARVKCTQCGKELFVAYSCKQKCCRNSCHSRKNRDSLLLAYHLQENVMEEVSHRQLVFTLPKRLHVYFRYDRSLLGDLSKAAWETVRDVFREEIGCEDVMPAMITGIKTHGDLINLHPHIHGIYQRHNRNSLIFLRLIFLFDQNG